MIRFALFELGVPLTLSRADYDRTRRAFYGQSKMGRRDDLLPKLWPPGSVRIQSVDDNPGFDIAAEPSAWMSALIADVQEGCETTIVRFGRVMGKSFTSQVSREECARYGGEWKTKVTYRRSSQGWDGKVLVQGESTTVAGAPYPISVKTAWRDEDVLSGHADDSTALVPVDPTSSPLVSDVWWYETEWGRAVVAVFVPPLVLDQWGAWRPAVPVILAAPDLVMVRSPHPYLVGVPAAGPPVTGDLAPLGRGKFIPVMAGVVYLPTGTHLDITRTEAGWVGRYDNPASGGIFDTIIDAITKPFEQIGAEVARVTETVVAEAERLPGNVVDIVTDPAAALVTVAERAGGAVVRTAEQVGSAAEVAWEQTVAEVERAGERVVAEVARIDDNLKYYVVHPGDAAKDIARHMTKVSALALLTFPVSGVIAGVVSMTIGGVAASVAVLSPAASGAISGLAATLGGAGLMTASAANIGLAVGLPARTLADVGRIAVYAEGFIPILPYAIEELTIQVQTSKDRRDALRLQLAQLRAQNIRHGGAWVRAAKMAVEQFAMLAVTFASAGAVSVGLLALLKGMATMTFTAVETAYQFANGREVMRTLASQAREADRLRIAAEEAALAAEQAEIDAIEREIAELRRQAGLMAAGTTDAPSTAGAAGRRSTAWLILAGLAGLAGLVAVVEGGGRKR